MAASEDSAPYSANPRLNIDLECSLQELRTISTLIGQHAAQGIEGNWHKLSQEMWWQHVDVLDWLSDRLKETIERAWRAYDSRMPANQPEQHSRQDVANESTLADLEREFDRLYDEWGHIADDLEDAEPFDEEHKDKILLCADRVIRVLEAMKAHRVETMDDALVKARTALKRLNDGSRPPAIAETGPPENVLTFALLTDVRDFIERWCRA